MNILQSFFKAIKRHKRPNASFNHAWVRWQTTYGPLYVSYEPCLYLTEYEVQMFGSIPQRAYVGKTIYEMMWKKNADGKTGD